MLTEQMGSFLGWPVRRIFGGGCWVRTNVGVSRQVYSLLPLTTRATHRKLINSIASACLSGNLRRGLKVKVTRADEGSRTPNRLFTKQVLCRLSYASEVGVRFPGRDPVAGALAGQRVYAPFG